MDGGASGASSASPSSPARVAVNVVAVTTRDDFLLELGAVIGGQASVNPVESTELAIEQLANPRRVQILMIDGRDVADVRADVDSVRTLAPQAAIVVFTAAESEKPMTASLQGSSFVAVLPLPLDSQKTSAAFASAVTEGKARQNSPASHAPAPQAAAPIAQEPIRPIPRETSTGTHLKVPVIAGGAVLLALLAAGIWFATRDSGAPDPQQVASPGSTPLPAESEAAAPLVETSLVQGNVDELLEKARLAMRERRYTEPSGDNALLFYRSAMAADPGNGEALDGLNRIGGVLAGRFEEALAQGQLAEAASSLAQFKNALPEDSRSADFQSKLATAQITKALGEENFERASALIRSAQQANSIPQAQLTRWRAEITRAQDAAREKREADLAAQREAAAAEQKKQREAKAAAAAEAEKQAQVSRDKAREEQMKQEQAAIAAKQSAEAAKATPARDASSLQSRLKRKRYVPPDYPPDALDKRISGSVVVNFTVDLKGEPRDIRIESATPPGVFDRSALAAVKRWRFEPLVVDGAPTEVPVRMAIRFAPQD